MFEKIVVIEPVNLVPAAKERLHDYAKEVVFYDTLPKDDQEIIQRIGDADGALISYTSRMGREAVTGCPNLRYVGMCCSLYEEKSANVDIAAAREKGITVRGVRDYGDNGVIEFVISELVRYLHGFGDKQWKEKPQEITGLKVGIVGMGTTGSIIADGLQRFGAEISYNSRTRKEGLELERGYRYMPLEELLEKNDAIFTCLTKNVIVLHEAEFARMGNHKILFNTSIAPSHDIPALKKWLDEGSNEFFCDSVGALGDPTGELLDHPHVNCLRTSSGTTEQAMVRLGEKVLANIDDFLKSQKN